MYRCYRCLCQCNHSGLAFVQTDIRCYSRFRPPFLLCEQHIRPLSDVSGEPRAVHGQRRRMLQPRRRLGLVSQDKIRSEGNVRNRRFSPCMELSKGTLHDKATAPNICFNPIGDIYPQQHPSARRVSLASHDTMPTGDDFQSSRLLHKAEDSAGAERVHRSALESTL